MTKMKFTGFGRDNRTYEAYGLDIGDKIVSYSRGTYNLDELFTITRVTSRFAFGTRESNPTYEVKFRREVRTGYTSKGKIDLTNVKVDTPDSSWHSTFYSLYHESNVEDMKENNKKVEDRKAEKKKEGDAIRRKINREMKDFKEENLASLKEMLAMLSANVDNLHPDAFKTLHYDVSRAVGNLQRKD